MSWQEAMEQHQKDMKAYQENPKGSVKPKKFFVDVYTGWCGWCKKMDNSTFKDPNIIAIMNQYYYPVKLDAEMNDTIIFDNHTFINPGNAQGKRGTHQLAASILDFQMSYPSYVILDENISRLVIYKGYKPTDDLLGVLLFYAKNNHIPFENAIKQKYKIPQNK